MNTDGETDVNAWMLKVPGLNPVTESLTLNAKLLGLVVCGTTVTKA